MPENNSATVIEALVPFPELKLVILFGSRVRGSPRVDSDLDVAVAATGPLSSDKKQSLMEALSLASGHPIDLVDLLTAPVPLLSSILSSGERIKNEDPDLYAMLIRRLWNWNADLASNHKALLERRRMRSFAK